MKKKIIILATDFPPNLGGVATYSWEIAKSFQQKGFEVEVICKDNKQLPHSDFKITPITLPKTGLLRIIPLTLFLIKYFQKSNCDWVFCTLWLPEGAAYFLAKKFLNLKTPYTLSVHGMEILDSDLNWKKKLRSKLTPLKLKVFQGAKNIFCVSQFSKDKLLSLLPLNNEKVKVIHNGANPEIFKMIEQEKKSEYPTLLTACRLQKHKGIDQVLKALPEVIKNYPKLQYRIIGDGPEKNKIQELINKLSLQGNVQLIGKVDQDNLIREMNRSHLFIMLSREENHSVEGFGLVFLEAALCGTASLGGRSGGVPEAIIENETGWLIDPSNNQLISQKLIEILNSPTELKKMGEQAYIKTRKERTWSQQVDKLISAGNFV